MGAGQARMADATKLGQHRGMMKKSLALGAFVVLIYLVTIVKLGPGVLNRPL